MSLPLDSETLNKMNNLSFDSYILKMKEYAKKNNVPIIQDEGLAFLISLVRIKKPLKILEIGTAIGYSASMMVLNSDAKLYTIERNETMYNEAINNINNLGLNDKVNIIFKDALEAVDDVCDNKFDIIFIDAAKAQYTNFFNLYSPLLKDDGIIITDNMLFHGVTLETASSRAVRGLVRKLNNYTDFLINHTEYDTSIFNIGDGMAVSVKKRVK